ncbi:MAG: zinc-ribbon domain containing protein, partial [Candidatus Gracilibacteria bacterium]
NSNYCNYCGDDKNCYLDLAGEANEDCYFNLFTKFSKNCADCTFAYTSELCYEVINCHQCWNCRFSMYLENCNDCAFCFDLKGCSDCAFCWNLRHKKHHVFNKPLSKEVYEKAIKDLKFGSHEAMQKAHAKWKKVMAEDAIHRAMWGSNAEDCSGDAIKNSKNCHDCYNIVNSWDCKWLYDVLDAKDCYDLNYSLYKPEVACELISTLAMKYSAFNMASHYCDNVFYCDQCNNTSECFGCIALNRYKYCILNKQYTKEAYVDLKAKLIEHMRKTGEWGEFFPAGIAPSAYNETVAMEYMPISKEEALKKGYKWKDISKREFVKQKYEVPDVIADVPDSVVDEVLACEGCGKNFKIISQEFKFYKERVLPVPRKCPDCRHLDRMAIRTPRKLWDRKCSKCGGEVSSTYEPGRAEKVYCGKCYEEEVYGFTYLGISDFQMFLLLCVNSQRSPIRSLGNIGLRIEGRVVHGLCPLLRNAEWGLVLPMCDVWLFLLCSRGVPGIFVLRLSGDVSLGGLLRFVRSLETGFGLLQSNCQPLFGVTDR